MTSQTSLSDEQTLSTSPLRLPAFRNIWSASLLSNFGQLILGVGAAWEMTRLTDSPEMVALVQSAMMLPLVLVAVPAGAIADMYDRRRTAMTGLAISMLFAAILTSLAAAGMLTPWLILAFCALIGTGVAVYSPAWQASVTEMVPTDQLPRAIALGSISYNIARSVGPAIGGFVVLAVGAQAAFAINAVAYLPLLIAYLIWKRPVAEQRLPRERLGRAIISGVRYVLHSSPIRAVLLRSALFGFAGATASALAPLIAKDLLGGDASTFGFLLGVSGAGAVTGAMLIGRLRAALPVERILQLLAVMSGIALIAAGLSRSLPLTAACMFVASAGNIICISLFNVAALTAPRWVAARAVSLFSSAITLGIGLGAWVWGVVARHWDLETAIIASGSMLAATALLSFIIPLPRAEAGATELVGIPTEPNVAIDIELRSGPVVIEIDYEIDGVDVPAFHRAMQELGQARKRNGGFNWTLARDIGDARKWTERFHCPTWGDYLRTRDRFTTADLAVFDLVRALNRREGPLVVRRMLERPSGSVRETPHFDQDAPFITP